MTSARKARRNVGRRHGGKARLTRTRERIRTRGARNARKTRNDCVTIAFVITAGYRRRCCRHVILKRRRTNERVLCSWRVHIFSSPLRTLGLYIPPSAPVDVHISYTSTPCSTWPGGTRLTCVRFIFFIFFFLQRRSQTIRLCSDNRARVSQGRKTNVSNGTNRPPGHRRPIVPPTRPTRVVFASESTVGGGVCSRRTVLSQ